MSLWVQKYGGTSVASTEKLLSIAERLQEQHSQGHRLVVVLSAMGGETDHLMSLARQVSSQPAGPALDLLLSSGERVSIALLSLALQALGCPAVALTGRQAGILTEGQANKARIKNIDSDRLNGLLDEEQVVVHREDGRTVWMVNREVIRRGCGEWWRRGSGIDEKKKLMRGIYRSGAWILSRDTPLGRF